MPKKSISTEKVTVFFAPDDLAQIRALAEQQGLSMSAFIRYLVLNYLRRARREQ